MTKIKAKNTLLMAAVAALALFVLNGQLGATYAVLPTGQVDNDLALLPQPMSDSVKKQVTDMAISDVGVQKVINGRPYKFMSTDYVGNVYQKPVVWYPEIHFDVGNSKQVTAVIDLEKQTVTQVFEAPTLKLALGSNPAKSSDYYTGTVNPSGFLMTTTAPTYSIFNTNYGSAFLLNAVENNPVGDSCNSAYVSTANFAQVGLIYPQSTKYVGWADTSTNCLSQSTSVTYTAGHQYTFKVYASPSSWTLFGKDLSTGAAFTQQITGVNDYHFTTNDVDNGVFFENQNTNTDWYLAFGGANTQATAQYSTTSGTSWLVWASESQKDLDCHQVLHNDNNVVMTGSLLSDGTTTWNRQAMAQNYPAC